MSKIQEFIDVWNITVDAKITESQVKINEYLTTRQTAIALTDPFTLKIPKMKVLGISDDFTIDGFDVTTLGQLFDWSYPADGPKNYSTKYTNYKNKPNIVDDYADYEVTDSKVYTDVYTFGTMSYLAQQYNNAIASKPSLNSVLKVNSIHFVYLDSYKRLKSLGGKAWFDCWMHSLYSVISGTKISVSKLKYSDYSELISLEQFYTTLSNFLPGYYDNGSNFNLGSGEQSKYFQAVLEAGDGFFPTENSTQSQSNGDYKLFVSNPLSDNDKKIEGKITFIESGTYLIPNSTLNGLPNPWKNPITNTEVPNNTGSITYNGGKSTASKNSLADDAVINLQNIIQSTYGLTIYLTYKQSDLAPEIPASSGATGPSSAINETSDTSVPGPSASTVTERELIFNVELQDIFSNADFGNLFIIGQEDETLLYDNGSDTYIGDPYTEDEFAGQDEFAVEGFTQEEIQALPRSTDLPGDSKDNQSNPVTPVKVNIPGDSWYTVAANFIASEEGFISKAKYDVDHYRAGFGTSQKLVGSNLVEVTASTTFTKQEAIDTLAYQIKNQYEKVMIKAFSSGPWSKLNKNQKAAVLSLAYNCGAGIYQKSAWKDKKGNSIRQYAQTVYKGVIDGNASLISKGIASGPTTGGGKVYAALVRRRAKESGLALA